MKRLTRKSVLLGLLGLAGVTVACGGKGKKRPAKPPPTAVERQLAPAPTADIQRAVEKLDQERPPGKRPWVFRWPLRNVDVTSPYGIRMHPVVRRLLFHSGVDFRAPRGEPVLSSGPGEVQTAGWMPLTGKTVIVHHPGGLATLYAHLDALLVFEGQAVDAGAPVGLIGSTGRSTGPHLHFSVYRLRGATRHPLDPSDFVGRVIDPRDPPRPPLPPPTRPRPGARPAAAPHYGR